MITADLHVHSDFSTDSTTPMEQMIEQAISLGFDRVYLTDHMDYDYPGEHEYDFVFNPDEYFEKLDQLTMQYRDKIKVLHGIELGLRPYLCDQYNRLVNHYPFDFVIGSSHLVDNIDPYYELFWQGKTEEEGLRSYFKSITDNINHYTNFDVYGHLDYIIRYVPSKQRTYSYETYSDVLEEALTAIIKAGKGIEVNTSGYKYGLGHTHPQEDIIKRYLELGGKLITIGSDAHKPEHMAYDFGRARQMLLALGVTEYAIFEKREPLYLPL